MDVLGIRPGIIGPDNAPTATYRPVKNKPGRRIQERYADFADYVARLAWPHEVAGVVLAQEIKFRDTSAAAAG